MNSTVSRQDIDHLVYQLKAGELAIINTTDETINNLADEISNLQVALIRSLEAQGIEWSLPMTAEQAKQKIKEAKK